MAINIFPSLEKLYEKMFKLIINLWFINYTMLYTQYLGLQYTVILLRKDNQNE